MWKSGKIWVWRTKRSGANSTKTKRSTMCFRGPNRVTKSNRLSLKGSWSDFWTKNMAVSWMRLILRTQSRISDLWRPTLPTDMSRWLRSTTNENTLLSNLTRCLLRNPSCDREGKSNQLNLDSCDTIVYLYLLSQPHKSYYIVYLLIFFC